MQYRLRTLLILLALGPLVLAGVWWASREELAATLIVSTGLFVAAVWLASRAIIFLNTHM